MEERILVKFRRIEDYVEKARSILPLSFEEYRTTLVKRLALERLYNLPLNVLLIFARFLLKNCI